MDQAKAETKAPQHLAVTDIRISFISGNDKHVALDISDIPAVLKLAGKGETALVFGDLSRIGEGLLNLHDDAVKVSISLADKTDDKGNVVKDGDEPVKVLSITPAEAEEFFD